MYVWYASHVMRMIVQSLEDLAFQREEVSFHVNHKVIPWANLNLGVETEGPPFFGNEPVLKDRRLCTFGTGMITERLQPTCSCGNEFLPDAMFCRKCGAKRPEDTIRCMKKLREVPCIKCKSPLMPDAIFCRKCGTKRLEARSAGKSGLGGVELPAAAVAPPPTPRPGRRSTGRRGSVTPRSVRLSGTPMTPTALAHVGAVARRLSQAGDRTNFMEASRPVAPRGLGVFEVSVFDMDSGMHHVVYSKRRKHTFPARNSPDVLSALLSFVAADATRRGEAALLQKVHVHAAEMGLRKWEPCQSLLQDAREVATKARLAKLCELVEVTLLRSSFRRLALWRGHCSEKSQAEMEEQQPTEDDAKTETQQREVEALGCSVSSHPAQQPEAEVSPAGSLAKAADSRTETQQPEAEALDSSVSSLPVQRPEAEISLAGILAKAEDARTETQQPEAEALHSSVSSLPARRPETEVDSCVSSLPAQRPEAEVSLAGTLAKAEGARTEMQQPEAGALTSGVASAPVQQPEAEASFAGIPDKKTAAVEIDAGPAALVEPVSPVNRAGSQKRYKRRSYEALPENLKLESTELLRMVNVAAGVPNSPDRRRSFEETLATAAVSAAVSAEGSVFMSQVDDPASQFETLNVAAKVYSALLAAADTGDLQKALQEEHLEVKHDKGNTGAAATSAAVESAQSVEKVQILLEEASKSGALSAAVEAALASQSQVESVVAPLEETLSHRQKATDAEHRQWRERADTAERRAELAERELTNAQQSQAMAGQLSIALANIFGKLSAASISEEERDAMLKQVAALGTALGVETSAIRAQPASDSVVTQQAQVRLGVDFVQAMQDRSKFESNFKEDIAVALGIVQDAITVVGVKAGSVIVDFKVQFDTMRHLSAFQDICTGKLRVPDFSNLSRLLGCQVKASYLRQTAVLPEGQPTLDASDAALSAWGQQTLDAAAAALDSTAAPNTSTCEEAFDGQDKRNRSAFTSNMTAGMTGDEPAFNVKQLAEELTQQSLELMGDGSDCISLDGRQTPLSLVSMGTERPSANVVQPDYYRQLVRLVSMETNEADATSQVSPSPTSAAAAGAAMNAVGLVRSTHLQGN